MHDAHEKFQAAQRRYFLEPNDDKFQWMTGNPCFSAKEKALLATLHVLRPARLLEVGCGEGGNLANLAFRPDLAVGVDLFEKRCAYARRHCAGAYFVCADGSRLPFPDASFDLTFCRDLLHHVEVNAVFVAEMVRVTRTGGVVMCIEACGKNPVIATLATCFRAERGLFPSNPASLKSLLESAGLDDVQVEMHQPLPFYRMVLHPRYGIPSLGTKRWYQAWTDWSDRMLARIVPRRWWAYAVVYGKKRE
ncbi:MAG: class I SAM-dependent methyltransferase [Candidatus Sumerlaeia bacterium]|nr:class I SAM-dependent methyltransferase [Candidatus Sumerlaeia bacterium]